MLGLFTRFFAAAVAIEMFFITFFVSFPHGFGFSAPGGGYEFPLMWGLILSPSRCGAVAHIPSIALIGKEL